MNNSLEYLFTLETKGIRLGLERTQELLQNCNNPQKQIDSIQIIGTNGKGSTASMITNILMHAGYRVGKYTSPHLIKVNERIQINNIPIENSEIDEFITKHKTDIDDIGATFFETLTVLALYYFYKSGIDIAVLETGLGGKYDSVSAAEASLYIFTPISLDHTHILGNSISEIAKDKASAIRHGIPCVSAEQHPAVKIVLDRVATANDSTIT